MANRAFTDRWLKTAGPFKGTQEFIDNACPNLRVRIGKRKKSFSVMIGSAANRRRIPIGQYPLICKKATEFLADPRAAGGGRPRKGGRQHLGTVKCPSSNKMEQILV